MAGARSSDIAPCGDCGVRGTRTPGLSAARNATGSVSCQKLLLALSVANNSTGSVFRLLLTILFLLVLSVANNYNSFCLLQGILLVLPVVKTSNYL